MPVQPRFDTLCIGSVTMDFIARPASSESIDINSFDKVQHFLCLNFASKTQLAQIEYEPGGSAANSANVMALLGSKVELLAAVGKDDFGEMIVNDLHSRKIGSTYLARVAGEKSAIGISILSSSGEKSLLVYPGANGLLGPSDLPAEAVQECKSVFITSLSSEKNYGLFYRAVRLARKYRKKIVFAPSITMLRKFSKKIARLHPHFDVCVMNYEEAMFYTKRTRISDMLRSLPGKTRVISKDKDGAYALDNGVFYHCPAPKVKVVDTTGAGDSFTGALVFEYQRSGDIARALAVGTAVAEIKLGHLGPRIDFGAEKMQALVAKNARRFAARKADPEKL